MYNNWATSVSGCECVGVGEYVGTRATAHYHSDAAVDTCHAHPNRQISLLII